MLGSLLTVIPIFVAAEPAWKSESEREGIRLESRAVAGSRFFEYRASAEVGVAPDVACDDIFTWLGSRASSPDVKERTVLEEGGDTLVVTDRVVASIASPRLLTFALRKRRSANGECSIDSAIDNDKAPATPPGWVRIDAMRTSWRFDPDGEKTRVTFTLFSEPGGTVPPFVVHDAQRNATRDVFKRGLDHVKSAHAATQKH